MADYAKYSIALVPVETLTNENAGTKEVIASEVNKQLGGSGQCTITDYSGTGTAQGYKNGTVHYLEAPDGAGNEVAVSSESTASTVFIKNTGYVYSSSTALGVANTTRKVKVTANSGAIILAVLGPGQPYIMPCSTLALIDASDISVETVDSDGSEATGGVHLAVEFFVGD